MHRPNPESPTLKEPSLEATNFIGADSSSFLSSELAADLTALGFTEVEAPPLNEHCLVVKANGLRLQTALGLSVAVDFTEAKYQRRFAPGRDLLCRACGWHLGLRDLWDLTAGLGADAVLLAQAGFRVRAFERNKYLVVMLKQALRQIQQIPELAAGFRGSLEFVYAEAEEILAFSSQPPPEVIYYDPMYPAVRKTALPSKELQVLREINGTSGESLSLVDKVLSWGPRRFVVKRPHRAPPLKSKPSSEVSGKLVRFDLYLGPKGALKKG